MSGALNHGNNFLKALSSPFALLFSPVALKAHLTPAGRALLDIVLLKHCHLVISKALPSGSQ